MCNENFKVNCVLNVNNLASKGRTWNSNNMENHLPESNAFPKKRSLKKQLSFDEKVTEFRLAAHEPINNLNMCNHKPNKRGVRWWTPSDKNIFACFCTDTSIHGLQYLGAEGVHIGERILWFIVFIISVVTSIWLINAVFVKYYDSPVVVTFQSSEMFIGDLPFPAVTICNMNRVLESKAREYMRTANSSDDKNATVRKARQNVYYLDHVCSVSNKPFSKMFNYSMKRGSVDSDLLAKVHLTRDEENANDVSRFLREASQPCSKMIQLCLWEGDILNCNMIFRPIETNFGKCCTFNMVPHSILNRYTNDSRDTKDLLSRWTENDLDSGNIFGESTTKEKRPRHQHRAGKASGLVFLADPALDEYFCTSSDSTGFRLSLHYSYDIPHVTDFGLAIRPNYEHFISVTPSVIQADEVIKSYAIEKRKCYFENEFVLKYYNYYSASNCLDECVANMTYEKCNCVRYYMPRDDSRDICSPAKFSCAEEVKKALFKSGVKNTCDHCLPTCTEIRYSASSTLAPMQRLALWVDDTNKSAPWAKKNVSIIHVYFGEDSTYPKVRGQLYGITDLIANTGGLLGLCMGCSLVSIVEVIYYFTIRPWYKKQHDKTHRVRRPYPGINNGMPESNDTNANGNGYSQSHAEAHRVTMKPGDDGKYHLQVTRSPSNVSRVSEKNGNTGSIPETLPEEKSDNDDEDSNL